MGSPLLQHLPWLTLPDKQKAIVKYFSMTEALKQTPVLYSLPMEQLIFSYPAIDF